MWSLLLSFALAQSPMQPAACPFGVNAHMADDASLQLAADAGIGWVRMDFNWYQIERSPGVYDWSATDRFIDAATAEGLHVYPTIAYAPAWAVPPGCDDGSDDPQVWCHNQSPDPVAWASFVEAAVGRYGDRVKVWGLWNEPNLDHFYRDTRDTWVNDVLIPGSQALRATCSDCLVAGPELANLRGANWDSDAGQCVFGECWFNGWEVSLAEILADAGDHIDIVTHHKYDDSHGSWMSELIGGQFFGNLQYMHGTKEITDLHAPGKPVWITEFGWETTPGGPYSPTYAADQLTDSYGTLAAVQQGTWRSYDAWPELEKLFWYDLQDDPIVHAWGQYTWGLLDGDGQPKEAYHAFADVIDTLGGCAAYDTPPSTGTPGGTSGGTSGGTATDTATDTGSPAPVDTGTAPGDTGLLDTGSHATDPGPGPDPEPTAHAPDDEEDPDTVSATLDAPEETTAGGCQVAPSPVGWWLLLGLAGVRRREVTG